MKKYVLTESQFKSLMDKVITEESGKGKGYGCPRSGTLGQCLQKSGIKGKPMFKLEGPTQLFSMLYQVMAGDTWNGIMNTVLGLNGFYGKDVESYERYSNINLSMNPGLGGKKQSIQQGYVLHLEGPYD
jgi:hypothetical protein